MNRSRREVLAGLGSVAAAGAGVGWLRVSDRRPYSPNSTVSADRPTNERVVEAANRLLVLDHRADITVEVLRDGSGETPYRAEHHRFLHQPSRRRTWLYYTTYRIPAGAPGATLGTSQALQHRHEVAAQGGPPASYVVYLSDGVHALDRHAPVPEGPNERPRLSDSAVAGADDVYIDFYSRLLSISPHVHEHRAAWTAVGHDDETVTFGLTGLDAYAQVPPLPDVVSLDDGCRIEVTFDRETGLLRRIVDERTATRLTNYDADESARGERQYRYRIETEFSDYGEATAPPPEHGLGLEIDDRLRGTWADVVRY